MSDVNELAGRAGDLCEVNFDGLVGPTHNYAGLAWGNLASAENMGAKSSPQRAALQGLMKMHHLAQRGFRQAFLPPQVRPALGALKNLGYDLKDRTAFDHLVQTHPEWLVHCYSSSFMWTANAATVTPSLDTADGRLHLSPANLISHFHRSIEATETAQILKWVFGAQAQIHPPLFPHSSFGDEGAANHTRFFGSRGALHFFVYGFDPADSASPKPQIYQARQSRSACVAVARRHGIADDRLVMAQQHPEAIDQGVFHNDVISVGGGSVFFVHEQAFWNQSQVLAELKTSFRKLNPNEDLHVIEVPASQVSVKAAVESYLFNSQLIQKQHNYLLLLPAECRAHTAVYDYLMNMLLPSQEWIDEIEFIDVKESMKNGGGPACLRLRVPLTHAAWAALPPRLKIDTDNYNSLCDFVKANYRLELKPEDLFDYEFFKEAQDTVAKLYDWLGYQP